MSNDLKAYVVTEIAEDHGGVVFARFHAEARRKGANEFGDGDWDSVECRRAPEFDQYAPGPISPLVLIEKGWWFECTDCSRTVNMDSIFDLKLRPVVTQNHIYCSPWCRLDFVERKGRRVAKEKLGATMAALVLPSFCSVTRGYVNHVHDPRTGRINEVLGAFFTFTGSKHGNGVWRSDSADLVSISKGDREAFQQLKAEHSKEFMV